MQSKLFFNLIIFFLLGIGAWGIWLIRAPDSTYITPPKTKNTKNNAQTIIENKKTHYELSVAHIEESLIEESSDNVNIFKQIRSLINQQNISKSVSETNKHYSSLSSHELEIIKLDLIDIAFSQPVGQRKNALSAITHAFDSVDVWQLLGDTAIADNDWGLAHQAHLRASELQNDPIELTLLLNKLTISSSHIRKSLEQSNNLISIKKLYQDLNDLHPSFARFSYELSISLINLGEFKQAKPKLEALSYDPELGNIAQLALERIEQELAPKTPTSQSENIAASTPADKSDLVVRLLRSGSSFLIDTDIERNPARLLLDTGASITSLSSDLIRRLKLQDTGRSIRLSTANGITNARLYKVNELSLGNVKLKKMIIAEIALSSRSSFEGLLGTDALNQLSPEYNYIIDNQKAALIFRKNN